MAKHTSQSSGSITRARVKRIDEAATDAWPVSDAPTHALDDPDVGVDPSAFYRWRRVRSEPPPPLGPRGSGLARYRRRDRET